MTDRCGHCDDTGMLPSTLEDCECCRAFGRCLRTKRAVAVGKHTARAAPGRAVKLITRLDGKKWLFWCPGCECGHAVDEKWKVTGPESKPTFSPSVLSTFGKFDGRCHLFVREGQIQFLGDCTHKLAGKTVPMEPLPWDES